MSSKSFEIQKVQVDQTELVFSEEPVESNYISYSSKYDHFATRWIDEMCAKSKMNNMPSMKHMIYSTVNQTEDQTVAFKAITKYMIPTFELDEPEKNPSGDAITEVEWNNDVWESGKLIIQNGLFIMVNSMKKYFSGFVLAIGRMSYHQKMSLITQCPNFCINNCVINVSGIWRKIGNKENLIKCAILFHLIERNRGIKEESMSAEDKKIVGQLKANQRRQFVQRNQGYTITCNQFAINWSFLATSKSINSSIGHKIGDLKSKVAIVEKESQINGTVNLMVASGTGCDIQSTLIELFTEYKKGTDFKVTENWIWINSKRTVELKREDFTNVFTTFKVQIRSNMVVKA